MTDSQEDAFLEGKTTVLLDLDGTLVRSVEPHARSWHEMFGRLGHDHLTLREVERLIGMGGDKILETALGITDEEEVERIEDERSRLFREKYLDDVYPVEGASELIVTLRALGMRVALASASSPQDRDPLLQRGGLEEHFHDFVSPDDLEGSKPDPDLVRAVLAQLDVEPSHAVLIGDSRYDAEAAYRAGVGFVGVETGVYTREELPTALTVFPSVAEIADTLSRSRRTLL